MKGRGIKIFFVFLFKSCILEVYTNCQSTILTGMETFSGEKFIKTVLIDNVKGLIDKGFDYLSFVIIGQGIEVLGSFFDDKPFDYYEFGLPKKRFDKGIALMNNEYQILNDILWKNLRCGLAHQLKPKGEISLTSYQSGGVDQMHLRKGNKTGLTYLVVDTFFAHFKIACEKVIVKLSDPTNTEIPALKKSATHLTVRRTNIDFDPITGDIIETIE